MKFVVFNGSPRGKNSNTHIMVEAFSEGVRDAGAEVENIFLVDKNIHPCMGCFSCWVKTPGKCGIKDDMPDLLEKMMTADVLVYASPVYVGSVTGIMKNFLDRSIPFADPHLSVNCDGVSYHKNKFEAKPPVVLISNCGFPEQTHFDYFKTVFKYAEMNSSSKIIAEIYRGEGELLKNDALILKPVINNYKKLLKKAGKEIVENMKLSEKTKEELEKPLIPYDMYRENANKYMDECLAKVES